LGFEPWSERCFRRTSDWDGIVAHTLTTTLSELIFISSWNLDRWLFVVAPPVFRARRAPFVLDIFLLPISYIAFQLSHGVLVSVHCYHARGPRFDPGTWRCYELLIYNVQFFQFRSWCLSGFEPENSRMVSEHANHLTTN
jgi:hypothetical protein